MPDTIMARTSQNDKCRGRGRSDRRPPPTVRTLIAYLVPFAVLAILADWLFYLELEQYRQHGSHVPQASLVVALGLNGVAISIPFFWLLARRWAIPRAPKKSTTACAAPRSTNGIH